MEQKSKKWLICLLLGFLLIQWGIPVYSVYGVEESTEETGSETRSSESVEKDPYDKQSESSTTEKTEKASTSYGSEESTFEGDDSTEPNSLEEETDKQLEMWLPIEENNATLPHNTGPNLLQNPEFRYNTLNGGTITNWEIIGTTTPVNVLTRNVTFNGTIGNWIRTSDSRFFLGLNSLGSGTFRVSNQNNTGTIIIAQTIATVPGRTYQVSADFAAYAGTASFTMLAYNGAGVVAGNNGLLNSSNFSLTNNVWNTRSLEFTASGTQTTVSYRSSQGANPHGLIRLPNVGVLNRNLTLQASPATGGTPSADANSIIPDGITIISANPNDGYHFVRWELVSGAGARIEVLTEPETTFTMGSEDAVVRAIYEANQPGEVHVYHVDLDGNELVAPEILEGTIGEVYQTAPQAIEHYQLIDTPENATGVFREELTVVTYVYETIPVSPVDPMNPETEVDPENKPELPEDQGLLSIDFASTFNFGSPAISAQEATYYAKPQRLLNEDGNVNEEEKRPNYIQISDRRPENGRNGWQLAVTQNGQFETQNEELLLGARLSFTNQILTTAQGGILPELQQTNPLTLVPDVKRVLVMAQGDEGLGTWIYRFGDQETAGQSIALTVPQGTNPKSEQYKTSLIWELSAVPGNE